MSRIITLLLLTITFFTSCTGIVTTNFPGKAASSIPAEWQGRYSIEYPEVLTGMQRTNEDNTPVKEYVTITSDRITWDHSPDINIYSLKDSLTVSSIDGQYYLSVRNNKSLYTVLRAVLKGRNLELYGMYTYDSFSEYSLGNYFKNVKKRNDSNDELNTIFQVTIIDSKLEGFFKSSLIPQNPVLLVRQ